MTHKVILAVSETNSGHIRHNMMGQEPANYLTAKICIHNYFMENKKLKSIVVFPPEYRLMELSYLLECCLKKKILSNAYARDRYSKSLTFISSTVCKQIVKKVAMSEIIMVIG